MDSDSDSSPVDLNSDSDSDPKDSSPVDLDSDLVDSTTSLSVVFEDAEYETEQLRSCYLFLFLLWGG